jgi:hypothetical protein
LVVLLVAFNLLQPPFGAGFGKCKVIAPFVAVPETAMNENNGFVFGKYHVGLAGQSGYMQTIAKTLSVQKLPYHQLAPLIFNSGFVFLLRTRLMF